MGSPGLPVSQTLVTERLVGRDVHDLVRLLETGRAPDGGVFDLLALEQPDDCHFEDGSLPASGRSADDDVAVAPADSGENLRLDGVEFFEL